MLQNIFLTNIQVCFNKRVNLGIIFQNENSQEDMLHIWEFLHKYVRNSDERVVFGGDQLTEERAKMEQPFRQDSGLLPTAESWHTKMALLLVSTCILFVY